MNTKKIESLLEKYYEGETSLQEEHILKTFFLNENIPHHLLDHKQLFVFYRDEGKITIQKPALESRFEELAEEGNVIRMNPARKKAMYIISMAASVVILIGLIFTFRNSEFFQSNQKTEIVGTITDADLAYAEISRALLTVSVNLNTGIDQMHKISAFDRGFHEAQKLSALNKYQPIIINPDDK